MKTIAPEARRRIAPEARQRIAVLGATKGMGRALARQMAERGDTLFLLGRDLEDLERSARDLEARGGGADDGGRASGATVGTAMCDLERPDTFAPALAAAEEALGGLDTVVLTAGIFFSQDELEADTDKALRLLEIDFSRTVAFCEEARKFLLASDGGTLCVFSSVAGERGRKPVAIYGAAKAGLSRYLEALDHKFRGEGLITVCVKPGFVKTSMTAGLDPPPFAGEPDAVAKRVLKAIDRGWPEVYVPPIWRWIMMVIRLLPRFVMRRIGF